MKRLLLPLILVILITTVVFVSCAKEDTAPTTEPETNAEAAITTTTPSVSKTFQTFKTAATEASTEFKGTPVIYPTTSTTVSAPTVATPKEEKPTTEKITVVTSTVTETNQYDNPDEEVLPIIPMDGNDTSSVANFGSLVLDFLG